MVPVNRSQVSTVQISTVHTNKRFFDYHHTINCLSLLLSSNNLKKKNKNKTWIWSLTANFVVFSNSLKMFYHLQYSFCPAVTPVSQNLILGKRLHTIKLQLGLKYHFIFFGWSAYLMTFCMKCFCLGQTPVSTFKNNHTFSLLGHNCANVTQHFLATVHSTNIKNR